MHPWWKLSWSVQATSMHLISIGLDLIINVRMFVYTMIDWWLCQWDDSPWIGIIWEKRAIPDNHVWLGVPTQLVRSNSAVPFQLGCSVPTPSLYPIPACSAGMCAIKYIPVRENQSLRYVTNGTSIGLIYLFLEHSFFLDKSILYKGSISVLNMILVTVEWCFFCFN